MSPFLILFGFAAAVAGSPSQTVTLRTAAGDVIVTVDAVAAPEHARQFAKWAALGIYDSTPFTRIEPTFAVQLGDIRQRRLPLTEEQVLSLKALPPEPNSLR